MNFIDNIEIKNFKSIRHQKIEGCKRINVFIGEPNVGKSNILEALGLYSVTQQINGDYFPLDSICRFNHLSDFYFDKDLQRRIEVNLNHNFTLSLRNKKQNAEFEIYVDSLHAPLASPLFTTPIGERNNLMLSSVVDEEFKDSEIYRVKYYHFNKEIDGYNKKSTSLSIPDGDNLLDILHGNRQLTSEYSELLNSYNLKLIISDSQISVGKELSDGTLVSFQNNLVSDTLRRLFFYKAAIKTNSEKVLLFEEPEAHMFPPYVSKFTGDIVYDENKNQFFIATHSPFVLNDLMTNLGKGELAIYIVSYKKETGETLIHRMNDENQDEAYQFGYDFFMNINQFIPQEAHG